MEVTSKLIFTINVSIIGLVGNIALFYTYSKKNLKIKFNVLMMTLAVYDIFYLITDTTTYFTNYFLVFKYVVFNFRGFAFTGSVLTTFTTSLERYLVLQGDNKLMRHSKTSCSSDTIGF